MSGLRAQSVRNPKRPQPDRFRQLEEILPTPSELRNAAGAPGVRYWQQRADYSISIELDETKRRLLGSETITYHNRSPDALAYLWVQLDQNRLRKDSDSALIAGPSSFSRLSYRGFEALLYRHEFDGGHRIQAVRDADGQPLPHAIVRTMMRVDLPTPLASGESVSFSVDWEYNIVDASLLRARSGYELFPDGNAIFEIAQWFPRMAPYTDVHGWHHKQFLGSGEFSLEFGDYRVRITAPGDHIVAATGVLQNPDEVLSETERERLEHARTADRPVFVVTPEEAKARETRPAVGEKSPGEKSPGKKTWIFHAENVRDFAWASSRKFIWDAWGHDAGSQRVLAMSFWPNEGEPLWSRYSTHAIVHTLEVYSRYTFEYPYPVAISVNGPVGGMEYPMICFNGPRPEKDGSYSERTKYGLISVVIHEVGHNYFPMIVNSDERQWTWMDEGLNTFLQHLAEMEWEEEYPSWWSAPADIVDYMRGSYQVPIMTNAESVLQGGNNAYGKPTVALLILRETILGRELFDFAFREYARRWMFKRPMPSDFFRTMEDASGVDLDWFWRGWFYSTEHCDLSIEGFTELSRETGDPDVDKALRREERDREPGSLTGERNRDVKKRIERFPELADFYNTYDELDVTKAERRRWVEAFEKLEPEEAELLESKLRFHVVSLRNVGGLVMPVILRLVFADGSEEELRLPAEIWARDSERVSKLLVTKKRVVEIELDPHRETADADLENNRFPRREVLSRFRLFKESKSSNPMREAAAAREAAKKSPSAGRRGFSG